MWKIKSTLLFLLNNLGFLKIFKSKYNLAPQMIFSDRSIYMIPHQGSGSPLFSLFLIRLFGGVRGRWLKGSILALHILQNQKPDPMVKTSHTIRSRCACVWNFFWMELTPLSAWLYLLFWDIGYFFFSFPSFFFMLLGMDFFSSFAYPISFCMMNMKSRVKGMEHFCVDWRHILV